jgi:hypothetical protein
MFDDATVARQFLGMLAEIKPDAHPAAMQPSAAG